MSTIQQRLAEVFPPQLPRGFMAQIAKACNVSRPTVSNWFNNPEKVSSISRTHAEIICKEFDLKVAPPWLSEGVGQKFTSAQLAHTHDAGDVNIETGRPPMGRPVKGVDTPPEGYVRLEHLSPCPSMGGGAYIDESAHVVRHLDVLEQWVRQKVGTTNPERIKVLTGHGQSMTPTIQDQDLVFVDIGQRSIEAEGIYVIDVAGRLLLKKALILSDGTLILRSDNVVDYPNEERHNLAKVADTICVAGRVLAWWTLRKG